MSHSCVCCRWKVFLTPTVWPPEVEEEDATMVRSTTTAAATTPGPLPHTSMIIKRRRLSPRSAEEPDVTVATPPRPSQRAGSLFRHRRPPSHLFLLLTIRCRCFRSRPAAIHGRRSHRCRRDSIRPSPVSKGPIRQTRSRPRRPPPPLSWASAVSLNCRRRRTRRAGAASPPALSINLVLDAEAESAMATPMRRLPRAVGNKNWAARLRCVAPRLTRLASGATAAHLRLCGAPNSSWAATQRRRIRASRRRDDSPRRRLTD